jgi:Tfp pilus assembly protein PilN
MFEINLLPWRDEKRRKVIHRQRWNFLLGIVAGIVSSITLHYGLIFYANTLTGRIAPLERMALVNEGRVLHVTQLKHQYEQWVNHSNFIDEVQHKQKIVIDLFDQIQLMTELPIAFSEINFTGTSMNIRGRVQTMGAVGMLMQILSKIHYFSALKIKHVYKLSKADDFRFEVAAQ